MCSACEASESEVRERYSTVVLLVVVLLAVGADIDMAVLGGVNCELVTTDFRWILIVLAAAQGTATDYSDSGAGERWAVLY